jgi:hypothetical protein
MCNSAYYGYARTVTLPAIDLFIVDIIAVKNTCRGKHAFLFWVETKWGKNDIESNEGQTCRDAVSSIHSFLVLFRELKRDRCYFVSFPS